jgi:predicted DNA-binding transcriptional regulator AlpA
LSDRWLSIESVCKLTSYSRATIYRLMATAGFPRPLRDPAVPGRVVWSEAEVREYQERCLERRDIAEEAGS